LKYALSNIETFPEKSLTVFEKKNSQKSPFSGPLTGQHNPIVKKVKKLDIRVKTWLSKVKILMSIKIHTSI
jgi:hypothetical protein